MRRYTKFLAMFLTVTMAMSLCACSDGGASGKRSREEQSENETKDFKAEGTTEPETTDTVVTSTEETTAETTEETTVAEQTYADVPVEWYLQDESIYGAFVYNIEVPGHQYKDKRVGDHPEFSQMYKAHIGEANGSPKFNLSYYTMDDQYIGITDFVLDGIVYPGTDGEFSDAVSSSICYYLFYKFESGLWVYLETDGVPDANGNLHGYIWYDPEATEFTVGTCLPSAELTQLNEELLMLGFAEPDPIYTGPYADVYAQYPSFNSDYSGYPIVKSIFNSKTRERFYFSVAFYNPVSEQLNNPDYYMDLPYDVAFPEG